MKTVSLPVDLYEVGDYVRTPDGVAIVVAVSENHDDIYSNGVEHIFQAVTVQHKHGSSSNTSNRPIQVETFSLIDKAEYDGEQASW